MAVPSSSSLFMQNVYGGSGFKYIDMQYTQHVDSIGNVSLRAKAATHEQKLGQQMIKAVLEELGTDSMYPTRGSAIRMALTEGEPYTALYGAVSNALKQFMRDQKDTLDMRGGMNPRERLASVEKIQIEEDAFFAGQWNIGIYGVTYAGTQAGGKTSVGLRRKSGNGGTV